MIIQTLQQRANTLEALNVMWPSVPSENVAKRLGFWIKTEGDGAELTRPSCGTVACFGGWCAWWPAFRALGVRSHPTSGAPVLKDLGPNQWSSGVAKLLFGDEEIFEISGFHVADSSAPGDCGAHELVTHRLQWLLANSEVTP